MEKKIEIDLLVLEEYPEQLAKVTAALAEAVYGNILKRGVDISAVEKAYEKAFRLCPNYRIILQGKPGFEKYNHLLPQLAEVLSLPYSPLNNR